MARLYLVRHGKAAAGWDADPDPGLDDLGREQAERMAAALAPLGPLPLISSPLRRARATAAPLEQRWNTNARIEPRIAEIPSPVEDGTARMAWLSGVMQQPWATLDPALQAWRQKLLDALAGIQEDTVLATHFIAINVAFGHATGDDRVVCFQPENASVTVVETDGSSLRLIEAGTEGATRIL